ncbi:hypothetical protein PRZ48_009265 [Zasmidium cellare]|uniref:Uncharacterized protein n=1 Tax=Zasmidium cellare TaxID=395010 RepID=A0ABR0EB89_ZASCE|nr:hypothetical protein PRZ48_009265 [Zasmidium cellare]
MHFQSLAVAAATFGVVYFKTTVTPPAVTSTSTSVITSTIVSTTNPTITSTSTISQTDTEYDEVTSLRRPRQKRTLPPVPRITTTATVTTITTTTATVIPTNAGRGDTGLAKRGQNKWGSNRGDSKCHRPKPPPIQCLQQSHQWVQLCVQLCGNRYFDYCCFIYDYINGMTASKIRLDKELIVCRPPTTRRTLLPQPSHRQPLKLRLHRVIPTPTCSVINSARLTYGVQYSGSNTLNQNNAGNTPGSGGPIRQSYSGSLDVCTAAQQCANWASGASSPLGNSYFSFNLYFTEDQQNWQCVAYYDNPDTSDYNVPDGNVKYSYGWQAQ